MANRKVLINRHTTGNTAPNAAEMFHGEIAVAHKTGEEILWTKNNANEMVPFISCAQTINIIDDKIKAVNVVYDVKKGENEPHIEVARSEEGSAVTFTLTSDDIMSEDAFNDYSAATKTRIDTNVSAITNMVAVVSALTDVVVTAITGDDIITATIDEHSTSSNTYSLAHKTATAVTGFNKLDTDNYGHVTAATPVAASDIKALGFEDSAWTEAAILEAVEALDSEGKVSAAGKYLTGIAIADGKISGITEADLPELDVVVVGSGNVVASIAVDDHTITYQTASVATSEGIAELSAATIALSAGTVHDIEELSGATKAISGYAHDEIAALSAGTLQLSADTEAADDKVFTSAKTYADELIAALDSETAVTAGKYLTGIALKDGKISGITEADLPKLSSATTGTGNVVTDIAVDDHAITFVKGLTVASDDDLKAVSGIVDTFSAATVAEFNSAFTAIQGMDKAADAVAGQVVTTVSQEDGKVAETKANVKDLQLGGYVKDTTATGDITSTDTVNAALSKLENKAAAITIANADGSINVTTGATGTDINVNIKSGEHVLAKDGNAGLYTDLDLVKITTGLPETVKERYQLLATDDSQIGVNIDVPKDSHIVSINYITTGEHAQNLEYVYIDASGQTQTTYVDMSELVLETEFASGVTVTDHIAHGVVDPTSESFLTVGGDGFKLSGVQDAIDAAIEALDVTGDTAAAGQYVAAIEQADGVVAVKTRANVSEAVLNNYAKGSDATAVAATDTVNQAISKLENQVDAAKAAATTKVVEGTDAGNNMTIVPTTGADGSVTYTVNLDDVASATALTAEIAARKAVDGQNGDTYAANTGANFISDATSLNDADVKLDAAIKTLSGNAHDAMIARDDAVFSSAVTYVGDQIDEVYASGVSYTDAKVAAEIALLDSSTAVTAGKYITGIAIADGKISGITEESLPANVPITATTGAAVDTPSSVLTGVTADGTDNHNLTFGMSNKVFSAATSDSALTSESALTSVSATVAADAVHASAATKVDNALTVSGYSTSSASSLDSAIAYDGYEAKSLTFGTNGPAGLKSMSMTSAGVVDVEVIDCGEY